MKNNNAVTEDSGENDRQSQGMSTTKICKQKATHAPEIDKLVTEQDADISENMEDDASDRTVTESETDDFMTDFNGD